MLEFGQILGFFSALVLAAALVAFVKLGWNPVLGPVHGRSGDKSERAELASRLMVFAFGVSVIAAVLAVAGWIGL
jgi:hypothetical protein